MISVIELCALSAAKVRYPLLKLLNYEPLKKQKHRSTRGRTESVRRAKLDRAVSFVRVRVENPFIFPQKGPCERFTRGAPCWRRVASARVKRV